jgi:hypothetical protein
MSAVHELPDMGAYLLTVALYRRGDGSIKAVISDMPEASIQTAGETPAERLGVVGRMLVRAATDLLKEAQKLEEPPNRPGLDWRDVTGFDG